MSTANLKREWDKSHALYLTGRSYLDPVDQLAVEMERKWGCGRLRLLVPRERREAFDRQRYMLNQAIQFGAIADIVEQTRRMTNAWLALDAIATEAGHAQLPKEVWETVLPDGGVLALCPNQDSARQVIQEGRRVVVVTIDEVARLFAHFQDVVAVKLRMPGAEVVRSSPPTDPLDAIETPAGLDTEFHNDDPIIRAG